MRREAKTVNERRRAARAAIAMAVLAAVVAVPSLALGSAASNAKSFDDTRGELFAAPDIVRTTVSNTDAGVLRFAIALSNRPVFGRDMLALIFIDTVKGGDPEFNGADFVIQLESGLPLLFRWNGKDFVRAAADGGLGYSYPATGPVIQLSSTALGSPKRIAFSELVGSGVTRNGQGESVYTNFKADASPNQASKTFTYDIVTRIRLVGAKATVSPAKPTAGGAVAVVLPVAATDTGPLTRGTVQCTARVGGVPLTVRTKVVANGVATCGFRLPAGSEGKVVTGTIAVTSRGLAVRRAFSTTVG